MCNTQIHYVGEVQSYFFCVCVTPYRNHFALETGRPYFVLRCVNSFARCAGLDIVAVGLEASA